MRLALWTAFWTFLIDQASKYAVVHILNLREVGAIDVLPPLLNFRMAWNYGINFGLLSGNTDLTRWILITVALTIAGAVTWWIHREPQRPIAQIAAGLMIGGALGNVIDRILYGAVADFLNMSCCGISNPFSFNVADIAIFAGAIGMIMFTSDQKQA